MNDLISRLRDYRMSIEIERLKLINAEFRRVNAPRATLEMLVRLGYEMEVLSTMRCCELLGENIEVFKDRGWEQSVIRDVLVAAMPRVGDTDTLAADIMELVKRWDEP